MKERISAMHDTLNMLMGFGAEEDATIAELRERIEALEARVSVEERAEPEWPKVGRIYYYVTDRGAVASSTWMDDAIDRDRRDFLGAHKTRASAVWRAEKIHSYVRELANSDLLAKDR